MRPRVAYTSQAQVPRCRVPSDSTSEWMRRALSVMEGKVLPYAVCVDLDMTVWPYFADRDFAPPYQVDATQGCPAVKLGNGKTMTIANETAGILRAFYARRIPICICSRSSDRDRCLRMADVLMIDHPDNYYTFRSFWSPAFCIQKAKANKNPHIASIQEQLEQHYNEEVKLD